jgi:hypothetical protein
VTGGTLLVALGTFLVVVVGKFAWRDFSLRMRQRAHLLSKRERPLRSSAR